jgi:hypothetical protein
MPLVLTLKRIFIIEFDIDGGNTPTDTGVFRHCSLSTSIDFPYQLQPVSVRCNFFVDAVDTTWLPHKTCKTCSVIDTIAITKRFILLVKFKINGVLGLFITLTMLINPLFANGTSAYRML